MTDDVDYFRVGFGETIMPLALQALSDFVDTHRAEWKTMAHSADKARLLSRSSAGTSLQLVSSQSGLARWLPLLVVTLAVGVRVWRTGQ